MGYIFILKSSNIFFFLTVASKFPFCFFNNITLTLLSPYILISELLIYDSLLTCNFRNTLTLFYDSSLIHGICAFLNTSFYVFYNQSRLAWIYPLNMLLSVLKPTLLLHSRIQFSYRISTWWACSTSFPWPWWVFDDTINRSEWFPAQVSQ